jgi:hypothetical protein
VTSNQVGAYLLGLWGMPLPLLESTALHLNPSSTTSMEFSVLTAVHVANVLACEETRRGNGLALPKLDSAYLATLELPKKTDAWRKFLASAPQPTSVMEHHDPSRARSSTPASKEGTHSPRNLLLVLGVAALALAAAAIWRHAAPVSRSPGSAHAQATKAPSGNDADKATAAGPAADPIRPASDPAAFNSIKVQGIIYSVGHPMAMINGKSLGVGERINGVQVVSIDRTVVVLACDGAQKTFNLK